MTKLIAIFVSVLTITFFSFYGTKSVSIDTANTNNNKIIKQHTAEAEPPPISEEGNMSAEAFIKARKQARAMKAKAKQEPKTMMSKKAKSTSGTPQWEFRGPATFGRITAIVADPENPDKVYVGTPLGGVWKSTDGGAHYKPIFDNAGSLAIGDLALNPHDSDTIYVGTGEGDNVGDGLWKSTDGGKTWEHLNLENTYYISKILLNPNSSDEIFVVAGLSQDQPNEVVYKSSDGGNTWKKLLLPNTSIRTIQMDPSNSRRLYAVYPNDGIWKTEDSGDHWKKLTKGLPSTEKPTSFSLAPSSPNRLYVAYPQKNKNANNRSYIVYRSDDYGETWQRKPSRYYGKPDGLIAQYSYYCGKLIVSPTNKDVFYILDMNLYKSIDAGDNFSNLNNTFSSANKLHGDHHAMWISPDGETIYEGNDGGIYKSTDSGTSYTFQSIPIGQFYAIEVDPINHNKIYGGMQDNGSGYTTNGKDWNKVTANDGFTVLVDNTDSNYQYYEMQRGRIIINNSDSTFIAQFKIPKGPWHTQMVLDPSNNKIAYYGGEYLYTTTRTGNTISALVKASQKKFFNHINAIDISIAGHGNTIYVGDGINVWLSKNKGNTWENVAANNSITRISTDSKNDAIAYYSSSRGNKNLYKTTNYGKTWTSIHGNLPKNTPIYDILVDPDYSDTLYCASMFDVYVSFNGGKVWESLGQNLPETKIKDLKIIKEGSEIILYAGTYGRGIYSIRLTDAQRGGSGQPKTPTAPNNLTAKNIQATTATLIWSDNATDETGYKIIYNGTTPVKTVGKDVKTLVLTGLKENTLYTYSVKAYNSAGESAASTYTFKTSNSNTSRFNFSECAGSGTFEQQLHKHTNDEDTVLVGEIPKGIKGLDINLIADKDVDIRLYGENEDKIVHWPKGILNKNNQETKPYKNVPVSYSGFNGVNGQKGYEFIKIEGTTPTTMTMKAFGYEAGYATVNYSWTGKTGCTPQTSGNGSFTKTLKKNASSLVGTIPPGVRNVRVNLTSDKDLDIQLFAQDGTAIASWKPKGIISGATEKNTVYKGMHITWSGYNGTNGQKGHEFITISNTTSQMLVLKVYGYEAGMADVTYSWGK